MKRTSFTRAIGLRLLAPALPILLSACSLQCREDLLTEPDLSPPMLVEVLAGDGPTLRLVFNERVESEDSRIALSTGEGLTLECRENELHLTPEEELLPGRLYRAALTVRDPGGNSTRFVLPFWAWNPDLPQLVINEFNPEGSGNNPDCIELYIKEGGDCAGLCLYFGTRKFYDFRYVLPPLKVEAGDYLILHCRREFNAEEVNETDNKGLSGGKLSSSEAWDLWFPEDRGMSGANGVLCLYGAPEGKLLDAVVYSERTPDPEDDYLGWTARTFDPVGDLYRLGGWDFSSEAISPAEAVASHHTTGTRSLCRGSDSADNDNAADWHTVPTGGKSFGSVNSDEVHTP